MTETPETLESYARIFEMRRRYYDKDTGQWYWVGPTEIELAASRALRFMATASGERMKDAGETK